VVRSPAGGLSVDLRGKAAGRGAYLDPDPVCLERGLREGALGRALAVTIDDVTAERLRAEMADAARARQSERRADSRRGAKPPAWASLSAKPRDRARRS